MTTQTEVDVQIGERYAIKVGKHFAQVTVLHFLNEGGVEVETASGKRMVVRDVDRLTPASDEATPKGGKAAPERTCYVCGKKARSSEKLITVGQGFYRHKDCQPVEDDDRADGEKKPRRKGKGGVLDAAAQVLAETGEPMNAGEMIQAILAKKLWSTKGKTPAATLYASILREINKRENDARFVKVERGKFALRK